MKKTFTLWSVYLLLMTSAVAQAPDFTATDINGNTHSLYEDYLDNGKTVLLDFGATWCVPCWNLHESKALERTYKILGPSGTGDVMILSIETDPGTTLNDLYGTGSNTLGDWVTGTSYPIINEGGGPISGTYGIIALPTPLRICKDGSSTILDWGETNYIYYLVSLLECVKSDFDNDPRILFPITTEYACNSTNPLVFVHNNGQTPFTNLDFEIKREGQVLSTFNQDISLSPGASGFFELEQPVEMMQNQAETNFTVAIVSPDDDVSNNEIDFTIKSPPIELNNEITIKLDVPVNATFGVVFYKIFDSNGDVVYETPEPMIDGNGQLIIEYYFDQYEANLTLPYSDCYTFKNYYQYNDWGGSDGNSPFNPIAPLVHTIISDSDGNVAFDDLVGDAIVPEIPIKVGDMVNSTASIIEELKTVNVYPNIAFDYSTLSFNLSQSTTLSIVLTNQLGQKVLDIADESFSEGSHSLNIDLEDLSSGSYYLTMRSDKGTTTKKLIKA